jgi:NDP-sugar pyrophosphorylase family protein
VGTCVEVKNSIIFDKVDLAHFNYVGDSILGYGSHLGGGAITSNLRLDERSVVVSSVDTGLIKVGALVGDYAQVGCNAILNPGTVLGRGSVVYPLVSVKGVVAPESVVKA